MSGLYIHIPFCKQRCFYCDFYSTVGAKMASRYVDALVAELKMRCREIDMASIHTLYIGGGTPSFLPPSLLEKLCGAVADYVDWRQLDEATIEVNPEDVTLEYATKLRAIGFSRVSMGAQSMVDEELKAVNRRHSAAKVVEAFDALRGAGFDNISIDLIYGLPKQTLETWKYSIGCVLDLAPEHISAYSLMLTEGTPLYKLWKRGCFNEVSDEQYVEMYDTLVATLGKAGYEHYEISNFALPGRYSRHNSAYWDMSAYLGLGASAYSWDGHVRRANVSEIHRYIYVVERGESPCVEEPESDNDRYNDYLLTCLRTSRGIDLDVLQREFGESRLKHFLKNVEQFVGTGAIERCGRKYRISESSMMMSDAVIRELIIVE